jgi:hypothetical protein
MTTTDTTFIATGPANNGFLASGTFSLNGAVLIGGNNGVVAEGTNNGVVGVGTGRAGVVGGSDNGYGGWFTGGRAPLMLGPSSTAGAPNSGTHQMGELYVDVNGVLYFCTGTGTPGTWKTVQLV